MSGPFTGTLASIVSGEKINGTDLGNWHDIFDALSGPWTAFTPGLTNVTVGNGTLAASYMQVIKLVHFKISLTFGSSTTFGTLPNSPRFALPVTAADSIAVMPCILYDNSAAATRNPGICTLNSSTLVPYGPNGDVDSAHPFTWAVSDVFRVSGTYEAA